jgi:hypothetical protein
MKRRTTFWAISIFSVAVLASFGAAADDDRDETPRNSSSPYVSGEISVKLLNDWTFETQDDSEQNQLHTQIEAELEFHLNENIHVETELVYEVLKDPDLGENREFADHGLYPETLTLNYQDERLHLFGGKFTPNFGIAYERAPGVCGTNISEAQEITEDYEMKERIGFGGGVSFGGGDVGKHTIASSLFFRDTSILSSSIITGRGRTKKRDGGPSNLERLTSYSVSLDGEDIKAIPGFSYHLSYIYQDVEEAFEETGEEIENTDNETGLVFAAVYEIPLGEEVTITPMLEYVRMDNFEGEEDVNRDYLTLASQVDYGPWNLAVGYTKRETDNVESVNVEDQLVHASVGYEFSSGLGIDLGWLQTDISGMRLDAAGVIFSYFYEF